MEFEDLVVFRYNGYGLVISIRFQQIHEVLVVFLALDQINGAW